MRRFAVALLLLSVGVTTTYTQDALTRDQRIDDLNALASFYAKNYAPYEWKKETQGFDLLRLTPWLHRIRHADDLEFQEALIEYVASLNDAHDLIAFPTTFSASLPMSVDIYDGKVLIEGLSPVVFPGAQRGDELVSLDGRPVHSLIADFRKYAIAANRRSTDRVAASRIVSRSQQIMPHISDLGDTATVVIRLAATGTTNTYVVPWSKFGIPVISQGPVPSPRRGNGRLALGSETQGLASAPAGAAPASLFQLADGGATDNTLPSYMEPVRALLNVGVSKDYYSVLGIGSRFPVWAPPPGFVQRPVPAGVPAFLLTGTYVSNGVRIGLLRIPTMSPPSAALILQHLDQEIAFFNDNTDVLVIDVMRNPGGLVSFVESISQRFMPGSFQTIGFEIRATAAWLFSFAAQLTNARLNPVDAACGPREPGGELQRGAQGLQRGPRAQRARVAQRNREPHARACGGQVYETAHGADRRILCIRRRHVSGHHSEQQPRAAIRDADDGRGWQRRRVQRACFHREFLQSHRVLDEPRAPGAGARFSAVAIHRKRRGAAGYRRGLDDSGQSDEQRCAVRAGLYGGGRQARAAGHGHAVDKRRRARRSSCDTDTARGTQPDGQG